VIVKNRDGLFILNKRGKFPMNGLENFQDLKVTISCEEKKQMRTSTGEVIKTNQIMNILKEVLNDANPAEEVKWHVFYEALDHRARNQRKEAPQVMCLIREFACNF
jgi:hypothetical protein